MKVLSSTTALIHEKINIVFAFFDCLYVSYQILPSELTEKYLNNFRPMPKIITRFPLIELIAPAAANLRRTLKLV